MITFNSYARSNGRGFSLSHEEEYELIQQAQAGNSWAEGRLLDANAGLIHAIAMECWRPSLARSLELEDLEIEGGMGFVTAVRRFDTSTDNHLCTYSSWWIRQSILRAIGRQGYAIYIPQNTRKKIPQIFSTLDELREEFGNEDLAFEETAGRMHMTSARMRDLLDVSYAPQSLSDPKYSEGSESNDRETSLGDYIMDTDCLSPEDYAINSIIKDDIARALATLPPREEMVMRLRYGFDGDGDWTLEAIANHLGLSKERIRQIVEEARVHLRQVPWLDGYGI